MARTCANCNKRLPAGARSNRRYCTTACRVTAHRKRARQAYPRVNAMREATAHLEFWADKITAEPPETIVVPSSGAPDRLEGDHIWHEIQLMKRQINRIEEVLPPPWRKVTPDYIPDDWTEDQ